MGGEESDRKKKVSLSGANKLSCCRLGRAQLARKAGLKSGGTGVMETSR